MFVFRQAYCLLYIYFVKIKSKHVQIYYLVLFKICVEQSHHYLVVVNMETLDVSQKKNYE